MNVNPSLRSATSMMPVVSPSQIEHRRSGISPSPSGTLSWGHPPPSNGRDSVAVPRVHPMNPVRQVILDLLPREIDQGLDGERHDVGGLGDRFKRNSAQLSIQAPSFAPSCTRSPSAAVPTTVVPPAVPRPIARNALLARGRARCCCDARSQVSAQAWRGARPPPRSAR